MSLLFRYSLAAGLALMLNSASIWAFPITYTIRAQAFDNGVLGPEMLTAVIVYESTTPDTSTMTDQGFFTGGLISTNFSIDGTQIAFDPVTEEELFTNAGGTFLFDQFNGSFRTGVGGFGNDRFSFTTEFTMGTLVPPNELSKLPTFFDNTQLLLGGVSFTAGSAPTAPGFWEMQSITAQTPLPDGGSTLSALGLSLAGLLIMYRKASRPNPAC